MLQNVSLPPSRRALEFGIYRDGDNNLDAIQEVTLAQARAVSAKDSRIEFTVQDTTSMHAGDGGVKRGSLHTNEYTISDGDVHDATIGKAHDMSDRGNLAAFVAHTLDDAQAGGAKETWIDLVDHGGGDGGGLETRDGSVMNMPDIAGAVAAGIALHAKEHPEDAGRGVDGVVANQCLMDTMGFADALSHAGVKYLAASPETMLAPGVPSTVAHDIAGHAGDPKAIAQSMVRDVMRTKYGVGDDRFGPAAAFDVLDLDPDKIVRAEDAIKRFNDDAAAAASKDPASRDALREDARAVDGMVRFPGSSGLPWHADRPAIALYGTIASDARLGDAVRSDARAAGARVSDLVLAHGESTGFEPFGGSDYSDAAGPTVHVPVKHSQIDPWAPSMSETDNAFYKNVDEAKFTHVVA